MALAKDGDRVTIDLSIKTGDGAEYAGGKQTITIGKGDTFRQIETAIIGMEQGDEKSFTLAADDAFGPRRDDLIGPVARKDLPKVHNPTVGMELTAKNGSGETINLVVTEVDEEKIVVDANHPLAGHDLQIALTLLDISSP